MIELLPKTFEFTVFKALLDDFGHPGGHGLAPGLLLDARGCIVRYADCDPLDAHNISITDRATIAQPQIQAAQHAYPRTVSLAAGFAAPCRVALRQAGLSVSSVIQEGDPKNAMVEAAENWKANTIFIGARGLRLQLPGLCELTRRGRRGRESLSGLALWQYLQVVGAAA